MKTIYGEIVVDVTFRSYKYLKLSIGHIARATFLVFNKLLYQK